MPPKTWQELENDGWEKRISPNKRVSYKRPAEPGKKNVWIYQRRDLTEDESNIVGEALFPKRKILKTDEVMMDSTDSGKKVAKPEDKVDTDVKHDTEKDETQENESIFLDHNVSLTNMANTLKEIVRSKEFDNLNINESISALDDAMRDPKNPLRRELPLPQNSNFFVDVLEHAILYNKGFIFTILKHSTTRESIYDDTTVIFVAKVFIMVAAAINPKAGMNIKHLWISNGDHFLFNFS